MTNRAQTAYEKFPEAATGDYQKSKRALQERFEPRSKRASCTSRSSRLVGRIRQRDRLIMLKT